MVTFFTRLLNLHIPQPTNSYGEEGGKLPIEKEVFLPPLLHTSYVCRNCHRAFNQRSGFCSHSVCISSREVDKYWKKTMAFK